MWRGVLVASLLVLGASSVLPGQAHATFGSCRSDPVVVVNGMTVDIVSTLGTPTPGVIKELDYTLTVAPGSLIGKTTLTVGAGFPEKVIYVFSAQQPSGAMRIDASVVTAGGVAPFSTSVQATSLSGVQTVSGLSNTVVSLELRHLLSL